MKAIGVELLPQADLPGDAAERMKDIVNDYQATVQLMVNNDVLDVTSKTDLERLMKHKGQQFYIMADGHPDAQQLLSAVHDELIEYKCCY